MRLLAADHSFSPNRLEQAGIYTPTKSNHLARCQGSPDKVADANASTASKLHFSNYRYIDEPCVWTWPTRLNCLDSTLVCRRLHLSSIKPSSPAILHADPEKERYFKILDDHAAPPESPYTRGNIKRRAEEAQVIWSAREPNDQLLITYRCSERMKQRRASSNAADYNVRASFSIPSAAL